MYKKFVVLFVFVLIPYFVYAVEYYDDNETNTCDFSGSYTRISAYFVPTQYQCASGQYLPANVDGCNQCPTGAICSGGTYTFNATVPQGISHSAPIASDQNKLCSILYKRMVAVFVPTQYQCAAGQYLPANAITCTNCPSGSACVGGTYTFNETTDQGIQSCANGTFAPSGSAVCYPHILHVGDSNVYLKSTKQTTPSLNLRIGNDIFYANMITERTRMNKDSSHYLHVKTADNIHYYVCDDTTCPQ